MIFKRAAAFLSPPFRRSPLFADSPKKSAARFPQIPDDRLTAAEAAKRLKWLIKNWPYSLKNYLKNIKQMAKDETMEIETKVEYRRGCGWREKGGIYLVSEEKAFLCGRLPIPLDTCPTCGAGFKPARGWTWIDAKRLLKAVAKKKKCRIPHCGACPVTLIMKGHDHQMAGLLWVGEKFYQSPADFNRETRIMGVCRRIPAVPKNFELHFTYVMLAHRKAIPNKFVFGKKPKFTPGIFSIFLPTAIEIVCDGTESEEEIKRYRERGLKPVIVRRRPSIEDYEGFGSANKNNEQFVGALMKG